MADLDTSSDTFPGAGTDLLRGTPLAGGLIERGMNLLLPGAPKKGMVPAKTSGPTLLPTAPQPVKPVVPTAPVTPAPMVTPPLDLNSPQNINTVIDKMGG